MKKIILIGMCIALGAGLVSVRATDTPVQAAARAALMQRLNKVEHPQAEPLPETNTPSAAAEPVQPATNATAAVSEPPAPPPAAPMASTPEVVSVPTPAPAESVPAPEPPASAAPAPVVPAPVTPAPVVRATAAKGAEDTGVSPGTAPGHRPKVNLSLVFVLLAALVPLMVLTATTIWYRHQRKRRAESLPAEKASPVLADKIEKDILAACGSCAFAVVGAVFIGLWLPRPMSVFVSTLFLAIFAFLGGFLMLRAMRRFREMQNVQPVLRPAPAMAKKQPAGLNGEPVVADQPPAVLRPTPVVVKDRQGGLNGVPAAPEPRQNGLNGKPAVTKERVVKRRKTVPARSRVRPEAR